MENEKNNAIEKVESQIANNKRENLPSENIELDNDINAVKKDKAQVEAEKAEKRLELERIKARKKAEREKAKAMALRDKNRKKAQKLAKREQLRTEKAEHRKTLREQKDKDRQERKTSRKGYGGWLAAVISLGIATLVLSSALTFMFLMPQQTDLALESSYSRAFYEAVEHVDSIDINLSKVMASSDKGARQNYLVDLAINSELAEENIQALPLQDENKFYTAKLVNQIGDYAKYLNKKLIDGQDLSNDDIANLVKLYKANVALKESLHLMAEKMGNDFSFSSIMDSGNGNIVVENFNQLQNLSVDYPELIYDGPFSDGQASKTVKGLSGREYTRAEAEEKFAKLFSSYSFEEVNLQSVSNANFECYNIAGKTKDGEVYAEISKKGGKLIMFDYVGDCNEVNFQVESAIKKAQEFLQKAELSSMKEVWVNLANNVYTINFTYEQDGIIVYPDMVKVRVCAQTNNVIGFESTGYYLNHTQRKIEKPTISKNTASKKLNESMVIETSRLVISPVGANQEKLCYEFSGEINGETYYVYIDAKTGKQVEMFKVVETTEGTLLI